jgi:type IV pilus assembly protein PilN
MIITLNLATRPYANLGPALKRLRIAMASLAVLSLLFLLGLHLIGRKSEEARARDHSLDFQIGRLQSERSAATALMQRPANHQVLVQAEALNRLFDEKAFSWTLAMEAMETVLPAGVQVSSIEPIRAPDGHITVHVRVVGPRDRADNLVANLERSRRFLLPRIVGESAESTNNPSQRQEAISISNRFDFDLLADYNPPTLTEERAAARPAPKSPSTIPLGIENPAHSHRSLDSSPGHGRPPYTGPTPGGPQ